MRRIFGSQPDINMQIPQISSAGFSVSARLYCVCNRPVLQRQIFFGKSHCAGAIADHCHPKERRLFPDKHGIHRVGSHGFQGRIVIQSHQRQFIENAEFFHAHTGADQIFTAEQSQQRGNEKPGRQAAAEAQGLVAKGVFSYANLSPFEEK